VKLSVLALDYDGTIAHGDQLDPAVREAIADARTRGITVLIVTGRILDELRRVAGDLHFVDGVVAENGAVVHFPDSGHTSLLAPPIPEPFLEQVRQRRISAVAGQCLVDAAAADAGRLLEVIQALELPLVLLFNHSRVMTLPQGVSKATGLHAALDMLRLSARNTVAIGDAENDHPLLQLAEVGAAVEWGSTVLRSVADVVVRGAGPADVASYIRQLAGSGHLPSPSKARRRLKLGYTEDGRVFSLAVRGRNVLIAGDAKSGKSWVAGLLCEQLILHGYSMCIIDPEGDYRSLEALPSVIRLGGDDPPPHARDLARALRHPDVSVIIDLSKMSHRKKTDYLNTLLPQLVSLRRRTGLPHKILLDEAHYYLGRPDCAHLIDPELAGYIFVTYRLSGLIPSIRMTSDAVVMVTRETDRHEAETLLQVCRPRPCTTIRPGLFGELTTGEAALLPGAEESHGLIRRFELAPRLTAHVRHRTKYLDMPVLDSQAFRFTANGRSGPRARTLKEFIGLLAALPAVQIEGHLRRHDFSRWLDDVFRDNPLGSFVNAIENRVDTEDPCDVVADIAQAIRARYETAADSPREAAL
jgi:hydroxymethylpyrimidine pyrophosphatase-like HAD family hydrolase